MTDVRQVDVDLQGKCNGGESHSNEKGCVLDMFCIWLVRSSIANLLSLPTLERDGYVCPYNTNSLWIVECPDGTVLKFKGFPFIDMENLQDHVFRPDGSSGNTMDHLCNFEPVTDFGDKFNALKEIPKKKAFTFLQNSASEHGKIHKI